MANNFIWDMAAADPSSPIYQPPTTTPAASTFNVSPGPQSGTGTYGMVPGNVGMPNPAADLALQYPNLSGTNTALSNALWSNLTGQLAPDVIKNLQDIGARYGISSGMPGSGLARNRTLRDLGLTSLDVMNKGIAQYPSVMGAISATQTVRPETQIALAQQNAVNNASPTPWMAQSYAQQLYNQYLNSMSGRNPITGAPTNTSSTGRPTSTAPSYPSPSGESDQPWDWNDTGDWWMTDENGDMIGGTSSGEAWNSEGGYASTNPQDEIMYDPEVWDALYSY